MNTAPAKQGLSPAKRVAAAALLGLAVLTAAGAIYDITR